MRLTAGIIGCGSISRFHFSGLEKAGARIKWVCDLNEAAARPWAEKTGATYTADYNDIISDPEVNLVDVTAISSIHRAVCLGAIGAGKSVICEKTLAPNADDAFEIVSAAQKAGTIFYTSYMKRFIPAVEKAKELLPSLGQIMSTNIRAYQCWGDMWTRPEGAQKPSEPSFARRNYGGGILICGGSHILDLVCFLLGRPTRLYASTNCPEWLDLDVQAAALLETPNGVVHYETLMHPHTKIGFLRDGWDERIEINGVNGRLEVFSAEWNNPLNKASMLLHYDNATGNVQEYRYDPVSPFDRAIAFFCENIARGEQGAQSKVTGYDVDELIAHITRSGETHQALDVNYRL
jgi:predicted dehydrogenase